MSKQEAVKFAEEAAAIWAPFKSLKPWKNNPRKNDRAVPKVVASIIEFGWGRPIVAREQNREICVGHTSWRAAKQLEAELELDNAKPESERRVWHPEALRTANDGLVPVRLKAMSEAQAHRLALIDNRSNEIAEWDDPQLVAILKAESVEVAALLGWDKDEVARLKRAAEKEERESLPPVPGEEEDIPIPERPRSEFGEAYQLGRHWLLCGDSTRPETPKRLLELAKLKHVDMVFTDPPFAIYGSSSGLSSSVTDDKVVRPFFRSILEACESLLPYAGPAYVCCDWRSWPSWWEVAKGLQMSPKNKLVWDKGSGLGSSWSNAYEEIGYFIKVKNQKTMKDADRVGIKPILSPNVIHISRPGGDERQHNAAKPRALIQHIIEKTGDYVKTVADLCGGSGSTLMGCEDVGRSCLMVEIDPKWADVIRMRWTRYCRERGLEPGPGALG